MALTTRPRNLPLADAVVRRTLEVIAFLRPQLWFMENPRTGLLSQSPLVCEYPRVDVDYCQFSDWGYRKSTRIWGTVQGLRDVLCDVQTCRNIQPGTHKHREVLGGTAKRMTAQEEYRVPAKLVEYLVTGDETILTTDLHGLQGPMDSIRVDDVIDSTGDGSGKANQCYLRVRAQFQNGEQRELRVLVYTGAQANLIRTGVVPFAMFQPACRPLRLLTVSGGTLGGGSQEVAVRISFHGTSQYGSTVPNWTEEAVFLEAQIHVDAIVGYPWLKSRGLGIWPKMDCLIRQPKSGLFWYLNDWRGVLKNSTPREAPEGRLRELESSSDSEEYSDSDEFLGEDEFLRLQKMQLTVPPLEIVEEDGEYYVEDWPGEEHLTPNEMLNIQLVLGSQVQQAKIEGVVVGNDDEWGEDQELVEQLRKKLHEDYDHDVLSGKFDWLKSEPPIRGPHCEAQVFLKEDAEAKAVKQIQLQGERLEAIKEIATG